MAYICANSVLKWIWRERESFAVLKSERPLVAGFNRTTALYVKRLFPRMSMPRQVLTERAREVLRAAGLENHEKAMYLALVTEEVAQSENPIFDSLKISPHQEASWTEAIKTVCAFLRSYNLEYTLRALNCEAGQAHGDAKFSVENLLASKL